MNRSQPRAKVGRTLSNDIRLKTRKLLLEHKWIPVIQFATAYYYTYDELLDAAEMGYDRGILEMLEEMSDIVELDRSTNRCICKPREPLEPILPAENEFMSLRRSYGDDTLRLMNHSTLR